MGENRTALPAVSRQPSTVPHFIASGVERGFRRSSQARGRATISLMIS